MSSNLHQSRLITAGIAASLLLASGPAHAQQQVNLSAGPTTATLPDGSIVPMWGYACGAAVPGSLATCAALSPAAASGGWSPIVITIPTGQDLQVNLTNNLRFTPVGGTTATGIPTSLVIVGQLGGGLGTGATAANSPTHAVQGTTWPIAGDTNGSVFQPPAQGKRVQSLATEVAAGATASLTWTAPRPGTYLLESGTHPSIQGPMGLYGILIVTAAPSAGAAGTAYPGVSYAAEVPLLLSEIDPMQNEAVNTAVTSAGFLETSARVLRDSVGSVAPAVDANGKVINAGKGYQVNDPVTFLPTTACTVQPQATVGTVDGSGGILTVTVTNRGQGCTQVPTATATGALVTVPAQLTTALTLAGTMCSDGAQACYPPAVNYTPLYYLVNGTAFDRANPPASLFNTAPATGVTGNVLVRLVNAGLRMHVPSIVGSTTGAATTPGFSLVAEDGNPVPGAARVQSEVFLAAGKTFDVMINPPSCVPPAGATTCTPSALPVYDRELSLSGNAVIRDAGMLAYISANGATLPTTGAFAAVQALAVADVYNSLVAGQALTVSDPSHGVIANDTNVYTVRLVTQAASGTVTLRADGTFTYVPAAGSTATTDSFQYCANGAPTTSTSLCATVTLGPSNIAGAGVSCVGQTFPSGVSTYIAVKPPGLLGGCTDGANLALKVAPPPASPLLLPSGLSVVMDANGGFTATAPGAGTYSFTYQVQNAINMAATVTATVVFPTSSNLKVTVVDGVDKTTPIADYRWIIEEDRTFFVDPNCTTNPLPAGCPTVTTSSGTNVPAVFGTNFHTSHMPVVATGCTGPLSCEGGQTLQGAPVVCDQGNGICRPDPSRSGQTPVDPGQVQLDPTKRYYISVLPGDAANPFNAGYAGAPDCSPAGMAAGNCGHGMGGAPIPAACRPVPPATTCTGSFSPITVLTQPSPYPPAKLTVFVFEDDNPLNGEHDAGGGIDVLAPNEPGLGGFQITLFDDAGGTGDATGQPTYDMFNMPLTNSLAGTIDPATGFDACPIATQVTANAQQGGPGVPAATAAACAADPSAKGCQKGIVGMIITCPKYESDGKTLSPLAGTAVVNNLYQGRYGVVATPGADRIAAGEEWLQTNTLDGQKAHDSFMRIGEPAYFQEFGPAGYHVTIGFANPKIINERRTSPTTHTGMCDPAPTGGGLTTCTNEVKGHVTTARMSRPPDERLYGSGSRDSFAFTQCYASLGDPDGIDFAFVKCDADGNFDFTGIPPGNWKLTIFDQWNDQIVDGISTPIGIGATPCNTQAGSTASVCNMGEVAVHQWQANIYTRTFLDTNGDGVSNHDAKGNDIEPGLPLVATNIRFRDGSFSNFNNTDLNGYAGFNEVFPLFSWYTIETDSTRYKSTGTHVVYDTGGPTDGTCGPATAPCGSSTIAKNMANTYEANPLPPALSVPGAVYCAEGADCAASASSFAQGMPVRSSTANHSSGRIDPPFWFGSYGWQGFSGQNSFLEFGKKPYADKENGGIHGHVVYASTRPFDDPQLLLQTSWEPLVPHVTINLYRKGLASDGVTTTLTLVDTTQTSSFDDWAQGFRSDGIPNMNCPGQSTTDLFFFGLQGQPNYLNWYDAQHGGPAVTPLPSSSQFKCYDGMHNWNQLQPAPYDGMYSFPSVTRLDPVTGKPAGTNCTNCVPNPDTSDPYRAGTPMLPSGTYVVEVVVPPGYELVKEEDKNILIGDNFIAPVTQQFAGLGNIFILPDQAEVAASYNASNPQNPTTGLGRVPGLPSHEGDTGSVESFWPCVGASRVVPDFISLFPGSAEVAPFAGATRNLCDRKEVTLTDQSSALAKFYVFTSTHVASHFTGIITDDFTAEFDPFSPQFGEKFAPAYLPVSIKDWAGNEISRTYADQWGAYNGLSYSTWEVNPPNPTGYGPTMMVVCMNDRGTGVSPDPLFQQGYSQFCYELPFMPGQTGYFDTPVVPTSAFSEGYNHPDCDYPDATPAISSVVSSDAAGPWVSAAGNGHTLTINALGDQLVDNYGYSGPSATATPFNQKKITRHYGFGATGGTVTIGGVAAAVNAWSDAQITATVPAGVPNCTVQQQVQYGGSTAQCGELVITAANGKVSTDTVTVTIGGKQPTVLAPGQTIQSAIDAARPGDLIILPPGVYSEMLLMWKPIRLQGVGAASSIVDANTHPAGKLDAWRKQVVCLFGLTPDGRPSSDPGCGAKWSDYYGGPEFPTMAVDRVPLEGILGWDTTVNGNLAEQLIEPSIMGAYEGAAVTVLAKGVQIPAGAPDAYGAGAESAFPAGTRLLGVADCGPTGGPNPYPGNFYCNPSSIDGLGLSNSSQGGGGIFVHAWGHNIQIANNRVHNNTGTLSGGITIGQGEHVDVNLGGASAANNVAPGSCETSTITNQGLPFCYNMNVNVHHNAVTLNSSMGDELFSSTPAGAGGITLSNGADYYQFTNNWVCGNMSTGDGGGVAHLGYSKNGLIAHNTILFNQSTNPTVTTNGGGILVMGAPDPALPCSTNDKDCYPAPASIPPSDGIGPLLTIDANLILGNAADSGSGGGLRLQHVNGTEVINFPTTPASWNRVVITNNIIANNVAGWDGGGVSLLDALNTDIVNNTIVSNDSTASAGTLFNSLFAGLASAQGPCPVPVDPTSGQCPVGAGAAPQPGGLVSVTNSAVLAANLPATVTCPTGHGSANGACKVYSVPLLTNDVIWQNRSFYIGVAPPTNSGASTTGQQSTVALFNSFTGTPAASQTVTGGCPAGASYWEIGVRGDTGPANHAGGLLAPAYSVLTDAADYPGANNLSSNPALVSQYCNGSRMPPENGGMGWQVPPGTNETNALPTPVFSLTPSATVDEGNNWINMRWGPLSLVHPVSGVTLANYALTPGSPAVDYVPTSSPAGALAPRTDFFGNPRPDPGNPFGLDVGAVETQGVAIGAPTLTSIAPNTASRGQTLTVTLTGTRLTGATSVNAPGSPNITFPSFTVVSADVITATAQIAPGTAVGNHNVTVTTPGGTTNAVVLTITTPTGSISPASLTFAAQEVGTTSASQAVTLRNSGVGVLTINGININGTNPANFGQTNNCGALPTTLAAGASCTINVVFQPNGVTTTPTATLNVVLPGATVTPLQVALSGTAQAPSGSVSPASLTFAAQTVGTTSPAQPVTLRNTGIGPLTINNISIGGTNPANFGQTNTCGALPATLAVGATCTINVTFTPNAIGARSANLNIALPGAATTPLTVPLSGTGVRAVVSFSGPVPAMNGGGTTTKNGVITVSNTGTGPLTITSTSIAKVGGSGTGTASIQPGGSCTAGAVVGANGTCSINVRWAPTNAATANLAVTVTDTGAATPTQTSASFPAN